MPLTTIVTQDSPPLSIKPKDWKAMVLIAAKLALGQFVTHVAEGVTGMDFGPATPYVGLLVSGVVDFIHRFLGHNVTT